MKSLENLLKFIIENWSQIVLILSLIMTIVVRAKAFFEDWKNKTAEEKEELKKKAIEDAKAAVKAQILVAVSKAEVDWKDIDGKMGPTKRAQVIGEIFEKYPILTQIENKDEAIKYIDELIDKSLEIVKEELNKK